MQRDRPSLRLSRALAGSDQPGLCGICQQPQVQSGRIDHPDCTGLAAVQFNG